VRSPHDCRPRPRSRGTLREALALAARNADQGAQIGGKFDYMLRRATNLRGPGILVAKRGKRRRKTAELATVTGMTHGRAR
jgi:hypothetical protein